MVGNAACVAALTGRVSQPIINKCQVNETDSDDKIAEARRRIASMRLSDRYTTVTDSPMNGTQ